MSSPSSSQLSQEGIAAYVQRTIEEAFLPSTFPSVFIHLQCSHLAVRSWFKSHSFGETDVWCDAEFLLHYYCLTDQLSALLFQVQVVLLARLSQESRCFNQEHIQGASWRLGWNRRACGPVFLWKPEHSNGRIERKDEKEKVGGSRGSAEVTSLGRRNSVQTGSSRTYYAFHLHASPTFTRTAAVVSSTRPYSTLFYLHSTSIRPVECTAPRLT